MSKAGAFRSFAIDDALAVAQTGSSSWQAAFFLGAGAFVLFTAWHGWRLGIVRQVISILALIAAYVIGYFGGGALAGLLRGFIDLPEPVLAVFGAASMGLVVYVCIIMVGAIAFKKTSQQNFGLVRLGYGMAGAVFGAFYGLFLVWIAILSIRLLGSVAETQLTTRKTSRPVASNKHIPKPLPSPPPNAVVLGLAHMKHSLEQGAAGAMVQQVDPIPGTLYGILHKLGLMVSDEKSVDRFLSFPGVQPLLDHPKIAALQNDPAINRDIINRNYFALIRNPRIITAANDTEIGELMRKFEFEKALDYAIHSKDEVKKH